MQDVYEATSDLFNLKTCANISGRSPLAKEKCAPQSMAIGNQAALQDISQNQFYNELSQLQIDRLQCSVSKAQDLQKIDSAQLIQQKLVEILPTIDNLQKDINKLVTENQILNGQIPKGVPPKPGSREHARLELYNSRNEEIKSLTSLREMLIAQLPYSETPLVRSFIESQLSGTFSSLKIPTSTQIQKLYADVEKSLISSQQKIQKTKSPSGIYDLTADQKIEMGTDEFLIAQMLQKNPTSSSQIKSLQCQAEKIKSGRTALSTAVTVGSFVLPIGFSSAGRVAFLMRAPNLAKKMTQISEVAGIGFHLVGSTAAIKEAYDYCSKDLMGQVKAGSQCSYDTKIVIQEFETSSCILRSTLALLPTAGGLIAKKLTDKTSLLSKYVEDIKNLPSLKKLSQNEKMKFLNTASGMSNSERKASTAMILEKTKGLTESQKKGLIEAHEIASNKGYFELTTQELKAKMDKLISAGYNTDEADTILRTGLAGELRQAIKLAPSKTGADFYSSLEDSGNKSRLLAEQALRGPKADTQKATDYFKKATSQYQSEIKKSAAPSERQYSEIEYVAGHWGAQATAAQKTDDVQAATKAYVDAFNGRFKNVKAEADKNAALQYIENLKADPGKGAQYEASQWKLNTIKTYLNSKGWNLR